MGNYNATQKNLLCAQEHSVGTKDRLKLALDLDMYKDKPEMQAHLKELHTQAEQLFDKIYQLRQAYDDKEGCGTLEDFKFK